MRKVLAYSIVLTGLASLGGGAANGAGQAASAQTLAALDPTRAGRFACRGLDATGATLARRLRQAERYGNDVGGNGAPGIYDRIPATDLPTGALDPMAKRYFEQGLALAYGFNHNAAIRSFRRAQALAPDCALCFWGEALANGPNINAGMDDAGNRAALAALERARALAPQSPPLVQALVAAQARRYSATADSSSGPNRAALDGAYADAMLGIARRYPQSDDVAILAAEAAMNTTPWNYFDPATGESRPRIDDAVALAEKVMLRSPDDPQAAHLYIHLLEAKDPKRAEAAADQLRQSRPPALGHLVHMPAHIYFRLGRWQDSIAVNVDAAKADETFLAAVGDDGIVRYGYYPHNVHFIVTSAQMMGDVPLVLSETTKLTNLLGVDAARALPWIQAIHAAPAFALAQYASPAATLALTAKPSALAYVEAMRRYARAVAYAEARDDAGFEAEYAALVAQGSSAGVTDMVAAGFPAPDIVRLAAEVAQGRRAYAKADYRAAAEHYRRAIALQRTIPYNEPPFWYYPVSQSLGAALFAAGDYAAAGEAFRAALFDAPNSGMALYGLAQTERKLGHRLEAEAADAALAKVWVGDRELLRMDRI
jgi:tetratricopeptide (TPR) repeat protein